jgi:hypothetical protein
VAGVTAGEEVDPVTAAAALVLLPPVFPALGNPSLAISLSSSSSAYCCPPCWCSSTKLLHAGSLTTASMLLLYCVR